MKLFALAALTVAFVAQVSAKIGFGACPSVLGKTNTQYVAANSGFTQIHLYNHEVIAIDKQLNQLLPMLGKVGVKVPGNINCDDLGTVEPFKTVAKMYKDANPLIADGIKFNFYDAKMFDYLFPNRDDAIIKMVNFLNTNGAEAEFYYTCVDSFSFPAFLA